MIIAAVPVADTDYRILNTEHWFYLPPATLPLFHRSLCTTPSAPCSSIFYLILAVKIGLLSLNQDYFKYYTALNLQHGNDGNPFAEPVNVYNNIEKGYGIFAGYSSDEVEYKYGE